MKSKYMIEMEDIIEKMKENNDQSSEYLSGMKFGLIPLIVANFALLVWLFTDSLVFMAVGIGSFIYGFGVGQYYGRKLKKLHREFDRLDQRFHFLRKMEMNLIKNNRQKNIDHAKELFGGEDDSTVSEK